MTDLPIMQINLPTDFIDLGMGNPGLSLLPVDILHKAAEAYFSSKDPRPLQYGAEQGHGPFRESLAGFLTRGYGFSVNPESLFISSGASSALDLICTLYTQPGDIIFTEEPTYFLALRVFEDHGLQVIPIPIDKDGLRLDALEEKLGNYTPKFIYTIPTFQNPSGQTLSQARRERLVDLAVQHDFLIVADEVYHFLPFEEFSLRPLAYYSADIEQVVSINSFSKILAPGLRLGWVQAHSEVIKRLVGCGLLDSGGGMNPFTSAVVHHVVESGDLEANISLLIHEYSHRLEILDRAIQSHLPQAEYIRPQGGFFYWLRLPGVDMTALRRRTKNYRIDIRPGKLFSSNSGLNDYMRLSYCCYSASKLVEGIRRLKDCLKNDDSD